MQREREMSCFEQAEMWETGLTVLALSIVSNCFVRAVTSEVDGLEDIFEW